MSNAQNTEKTTHKFTEAGLGLAPFKFVGFEDTAAKVNTEDGMVRTTIGGMDVYTKPGGSCDYCGTYIVQFCHILSADGKHFKVGTSCVKKTGDAGLVKVAKREASRVRRAAAKVREEARIAAARVAFLDDVDGCRSYLEGVAHPTQFRAEQGATWADCWRWFVIDSGNGYLSDDGKPFPGAGHKGQMDMTRLLDRILKGERTPPVWHWQKEGE